MWFLNRTAKPPRPPGLGEFTKVLPASRAIGIITEQNPPELREEASIVNRVIVTTLPTCWTASADVKQNCTVSPHINIQARWCKGSTIFGNTQASTARCQSVISYCYNYNCQCLCTVFCCRCVTIPSPTCTASHCTPSSWDAQFRLGHLWCVWGWAVWQAASQTSHFILSYMNSVWVLLHLLSLLGWLRGSITLTTSDRIQSRNGWSSPSWKHGRCVLRRSRSPKNPLKMAKFCE